MSNQHSYVACVRESTENLQNIDRIDPFSKADEDCLTEVNAVLLKHGAASRFGVSLLHSHFEMSADEVLLEETDVENRSQTLSVIKRSEIPPGAIYMDRRFDGATASHVSSLFARMGSYRNELLIKKLEADLSLSSGEAEILFDDVKRFLALCASTTHPLAPPRIVDQAWHQFILITKDYGDFCRDFCGRFIHHQPANPTAGSRDYDADRDRTRKLAEASFGALSAYWEEALGTGPCTHNCGVGD